MYYHPAIHRADCSEEQLLRDIVYLLRNPAPFVIEPAYSIVEHVREQIEQNLPEPWLAADTKYPDYALEMAYALLKG